jgi:dihydrofolate reductase
MPSPQRIEGYAIVSEDGMLADAQRRIPDALKVEADQVFFHRALDSAAAVVHGRHSSEGGPDEARRPRIVMTRTIAALARDATRPRAVLWNPAGASLEEAWTALAPPDGVLSVIGGPEVYGLFLEIGYDAFYLTRVPRVRIPGGRPIFPQIGPDRSPEDLLAQHGLKPGSPRLLDAALGVTLTSWQR